MAEPKFKSLTLYVMRHGETEDNLARRNSGHNDSPLTQTGIEQARANGAALKELISDFEPFDFVSSSLHRACSTMEIVREALERDTRRYRRDRRLMECDFGDWTGWNLDEMAASDPAGVAARKKDKWNFRIPGGESQKQVHARVGVFMKTLLRDSIIVCHAGSLRMIRAHYLDLPPEEIMDWTAPNAGILRLSAGSEAHFGD